MSNRVALTSWARVDSLLSPLTAPFSDLAHTLETLKIESFYPEKDQAYYVKDTGKHDKSLPLYALPETPFTGAVSSAATPRTGWERHRDPSRKTKRTSLAKKCSRCKLGITTKACLSVTGEVITQRLSWCPSSATCLGSQTTKSWPSEWPTPGTRWWTPERSRRWTDASADCATMCSSFGVAGERERGFKGFQSRIVKQSHSYHISRLLCSCIVWRFRLVDSSPERDISSGAVNCTGVWRCGLQVCGEGRFSDVVEVACEQCRCCPVWRQEWDRSDCEEVCGS